MLSQVNELDVSGQTDVILENRDKIMQVTNECEQLRINADVYASLVAQKINAPDNYRRDMKELQDNINSLIEVEHVTCTFFK